MAEINCNACCDIKANAPEFAEQGVTDTVCTSLMNNTGLNPGLSVLHENCEDFEELNDCLIGQMHTTVDAYDTCNWKTFFKKFITNLYTYLKALNCSICGLWKNVNNIWKSIKGPGDTIYLYRVHQHIIRKELFEIPLGEENIKPYNYFSGSDVHAGDQFDIQKEEMDTVLGVFCQTRVVGGFSNPQAVAVQTWHDMGTYIHIDIDGYEMIYRDELQPYDMPVDVLVVGLKNI